MTKTTVISKKRRGPAPTGKGLPIVVRMQPDSLAVLDAWIGKQQPPFPSRPEAIRRLVEIGLSKSAPPKRPRVLSTAKESAARAWELATMNLDEQIDPKASPEERAVRKRKLVEGPSMVRSSRKDRPGN